MALEVTWLQDKAPDMDAMTDLSRMSVGPSVPSASNMNYQVRLQIAEQHGQSLMVWLVLIFGR